MDNISATIPTDYLIDWKSSHFVDGKSERLDLKLKHQYKPPGLNFLFLKRHQIELGLNARILKNDYNQGICINTLDRLTSFLSELGIVLHQDYIKDMKLRKAHIKNDIQVNPHNLMSELTHVGHTGRYNKVVRENSITYECTNISERTSLRVYGKLEEMTRNSAKYKGLEIDFNHFLGITRVESHFNDSRSIRKHLKTRNIWQILQLSNVNFMLICNILKDQKLDIPQVDISHLKTMTELDDFARVFFLNHICKGNSIAIKNEIKQRVKDPKYQIKKLNKFLPLVKNPTGKKMTSIIEAKGLLKEF